MNQDQTYEFVVGLAQKFPILGILLAFLGGIVVIAQIVIALTPSKDDDAWVAKVWALPLVGKVLLLLERFAPVTKKTDAEMQAKMADASIIADKKK